MTITIGVDFRETVGFVTDPNSNYYCEFSRVDEDYPVSFGTTTIGWEDDVAINNGRDRSAAIDVRVAGLHFTAGAVASFRVDLPSAGMYSIQFAIGDQDNRETNAKIEVFDDVSSLLTVSGDTVAAGRFWAADNTLYTSAANWAAANTVNGGGAAQVNLTFASTIARFKIGDGSTVTGLGHVFITGPLAGSVNISPEKDDLVFSSFSPNRGVNTYLVPDSDVTDGNWINESGNNINLFASVDEFTISDSDYIRSETNPSNDVCEIGFSNPVSDLAEPFIVSYRYKKTGSGTINLVVDLVETTTIIKTWTHNDISSSFVTVDQTLSSGEFGSIANFNNLRLRFNANRI